MRGAGRSRFARPGWSVAGCLLIAMGACSDRPSKPVTQPTTQEIARPATRPAETKPADADEPETQTADELPPSRYDSKPPYPVELHVRDPSERQPGWLRILSLDDDDQPAELRGRFPEQNLMMVETQNVQRLDVHIGHLPLAEGRRIILRIDGQGIELMRGKRQFVTLERRPTGAWVVSDSR